ncbi:TrkA C-terminal domain-containing protein [Halorubrum vacuolatum]|uniref:RCK C-terminal domain-containing protein n=1 Tax=Halorubrum vacuolatum TaxID=63740 RepID=A0A238X5H7_HALVU|nr:TrkA C-terminal domain-containing protein [Halorubrum vacuolatum]SNR54305.1 hypothetical protein SAMN06264855_1148 [Halorubrum vacuolatum]
MIPPVPSTVTGVTFADPYAAAVTLVTFGALSLLVSGAGAVTYRWYFRAEIPEGVAGLLGIAIVALYLNTASLGELAGGADAALLTPEGVFFNVVALGVAAAVTPVGRYAGDRVAVDVFALTGLKDFDGELSRVVRTVGRHTAVTIPSAEEIGDVDTYEPVSSEKKAELAGKTLLFPRRLTVEELRAQLVDRIKTDYGVGYVDVDLAADGTLEYFAVGSRATGIGPTLAPGRVAVALSADPPNNATPGDMVQVWRTDPEPKRVATGELRGVAEDVATLAVDEADATKFSVEGGYRLVTLPAEPQADREFASLLRNADETLATVTVQPDSVLVDTAVGDVTAVVAAVKSADGEVQPIPPRAYRFAPTDTAYLVGRPDAIRRFEADAAAGTAPDAETTDSEEVSAAEAVDGADTPTDEGGDTDGIGDDEGSNTAEPDGRATDGAAAADPGPTRAGDEPSDGDRSGPDSR